MGGLILSAIHQYMFSASVSCFLCALKNLYLSAHSLARSSDYMLVIAALKSYLTNYSRGPPSTRQASPGTGMEPGASSSRISCSISSRTWEKYGRWEQPRAIWRAWLPRLHVSQES